MNRQQRRKAGMKDARQPVFQMTQEDIERIRRKSYDKAYADAADTAVALLLSMPIWVMHEKYGWESRRLMAFAEALTDEYQKFSEGGMSFDQYRDYIYRMTGMKFAKNPEA